MSETKVQPPGPRCPTCGGTESEDIGDDVRRCANCTRVWIPLATDQDSGGNPRV